MKRYFCGPSAVLFLIFVLQSPPSIAMITDHFGIGIDNEMLGSADVVVAGTVTSSGSAEGIKPIWMKWVGASDLAPFQADFLVDNVVRGDKELLGKTIKIYYPATIRRDANRMPSSDFLGFAKRIGQYRCLVCLTRYEDSERAYVITTVQGYMRAGPKPEIQDAAKAGERTKFAAEIVSAIMSPEKEISLAGLRACWLTRLRQKQVIAVLSERKSSDDKDIAANAIGLLVYFGDKLTTWQLPELLEENISDDNFCSIISSGLSAIKDSPHVPVLVRLLRVNNLEVRKAVIAAMRNSRSPKVVSSLAAALDEKDLLVRYNAIMGLAAGTEKENPKWAWGLDHFEQDPETLTRRWKEWWEKNKDKYPSVESVLKEYETEKAKIQKQLQDKGVLEEELQQEEETQDLRTPEPKPIPVKMRPIMPGVPEDDSE